eukprot:gene16411-biopygen17178
MLKVLEETLQHTDVENASRVQNPCSKGRTATSENWRICGSRAQTCKQDMD